MELLPAQTASEGTDSEETKRRQHSEWQKWLRFETFDEDEDIANLEKECKNLMDTWEKFRDLFPGLETSELFFNELPSIKTVRMAVRGVVTTWEEKSEKGVGKATTFLTRYCDTLLAHSQLFSVIPQGDKYTSVFTGVVSSLVKAAGRHKEIAEGFSKALVEISDKMNFSQRQSLVHSNDRIRWLVILLYIKYFTFLCNTMKWFSSRRERIKSSFDQTYIPKKIQAEIKEIRDVVDSIRNEASLESQRTILDTRDYLKSIMDKGLPTGSAASQANPEHRLLSQSSDADSVSSSEPVQSILAVEGGTPKEVVLVPQRKDLDSASKHLETFDDRDDDQSLRLQARHPDSRQIPDQAIIRLRHWLSSTESVPLWIMGKAMSTKNSLQSTAAAHIILLAKEANVPCVWYICRPPVIAHLETLLQQKQKLLTSMLYSLIRQLCLLVPSESTKDIDNVEVLGQLDGSPEAVPVAIGLLRRLLQVSPNLICILDGLQLLEYGELAQYVGDLLDALTSTGQGHLVKLLVTTSGSFANGAKLGAGARLDCSQAPTKMGGRRMPGSQSLQSLRF